MWEHMRELADEQCDGNAGRKLSGDSAAAIDKDDDVASIVRDHSAIERRSFAMSLSVCPFVCLFAGISQKPHVQTAPNV